MKKAAGGWHWEATEEVLTTCPVTLSVRTAQQFFTAVYDWSSQPTAIYYNQYFRSSTHKEYILYCMCIVCIKQYYCTEYIFCTVLSCMCTAIRHMLDLLYFFFYFICYLRMPFIVLDSSSNFKANKAFIIIITIIWLYSSFFSSRWFCSDPHYPYNLTPWSDEFDSWWMITVSVISIGIVLLIVMLQIKCSMQVLHPKHTRPLTWYAKFLHSTTVVCCCLTALGSNVKAWALVQICNINFSV